MTLEKRVFTTVNPNETGGVERRYLQRKLPFLYRRFLPLVYIHSHHLSNL